MPLSGASSLLAVNVVLLAMVVAAQVVRRISLLLCVRVWDVWDVGVVGTLLQVLVAVLTILRAKL